MSLYSNKRTRTLAATHIGKILYLLLVGRLDIFLFGLSIQLWLYIASVYV